MKKFIVITSINPPTDAIRSFALWVGWTTVVVGDRKSPLEWRHENVVYLTVEDQIELAPAFAKFIPENTYTRKMIGYIYAFQQGADAIFESDDDNIPYADAEDVVNSSLRHRFSAKTALSCDSGWVNIYDSFGARNCWPRGFPLQKIKKNRHQSNFQEFPIPWGIAQFLADRDPDVDAVYRMTNGNIVNFLRGHHYILEPNNFCPINSQATLWTSDAFPLMFLPLGVKDRVTDILRGYMALPCLWINEMTACYYSPVVFQERNIHNLLNDFEQEIDLYIYGEIWCDKLLHVTGGGLSVSFLKAIEILVDSNVLSAENTDAYTEFIQYLPRTSG